MFERLIALRARERHFHAWLWEPDIIIRECRRGRVVFAIVCCLVSNFLMSLIT